MSKNVNKKKVEVKGRKKTKKRSQKGEQFFLNQINRSFF